MGFTSIFFEEIKRADNYSIEKYMENGSLLIPSTETAFYRPNIIIRDMGEFESALQEYINLINSNPKLFYKIDDRHTVENYLFYLIKSINNTDCQDFSSYIKRFCSYLQDENFDEFNYSILLGQLNDYNLYARRCEEYYGSETPYTMHFYVEAPGLKFEMPLVRYAISDDTAYIYSVQRKRLYNNRYTRIRQVNSLFNNVNKGVKCDRNITPSMLCSLTVFLGMLKANNISHIKADGFLPRRYGYFNGITQDDDRDGVLYNSVDKFFKLLLRVSNQFQGIEITSFPFDVDSYISLSIDDEVRSDNELLNHLFHLGFNYEKGKEYTKKRNN